MITNGGTGMSFRVNDNGSDSDATPFVVDNAGNVGIGTSSPGYSLHVSNPNDAIFMVQSIGNSARMYLYNPSSYGWQFMSDSGGGFHLSESKWGAQDYIYAQPGLTGATAPIYIKSNGNVGIGTTTPGAALEVAGQVKITGGIPGAGKVLTSDAAGLASWGSSAAGSFSGLSAASGVSTIDNTNYAQYWNWSTAATQNPMSLSADALTTGSLLNITSSNATLNSTNGLLNVANTGTSTTGMVARVQSNSTAGSGLTVLANGKVGIGTASPTGVLSVYSSSGNDNIIMSGGTKSVLRRLGTAGQLEFNGGDDWNSGGSMYLVGNTSAADAGSVQFNLGSAASEYEFFDHSGSLLTILTNTGKLGLGTAPAQPQSKLDVKGGVSVGTYAGVTAAPSNGIIVSGNVGIGTTAPRSTLEVNGTILTSVAPLTAAPATTAVNFATGNLQYTSASCAANFKLHNLIDGGTYTLAVKGTTSGTCSFLAYSDAGTTSLTVHMPPDHGPTTATKHTIYSFMQMGGDLYVSWITGY
jgi:hypothetical protein